MTMLYNFFIIVMMAVSSLGILHMIYTEDYSYILFPIAFLIGGAFKLFKDNDDEYLVRNPNDRKRTTLNSIWENYYDETEFPYAYSEKRHYNGGVTRQTETATSTYASQKTKNIYSEIASKCEPKLKVEIID